MATFQLEKSKLVGRMRCPTVAGTSLKMPSAVKGKGKPLLFKLQPSQATKLPARVPRSRGGGALSLLPAAATVRVWPIAFHPILLWLWLPQAKEWAHPLTCSPGPVGECWMAATDKGSLLFLRPEAKGSGDSSQLRDSECIFGAGQGGNGSCQMRA